MIRHLKNFSRALLTIQKSNANPIHYWSLGPFQRTLTAEVLKQMYVSGLKPCFRTIPNCFVLEHSAFKTFENVLRHGIGLNFPSDNPAFRVLHKILHDNADVHEIK